MNYCPTCRNADANCNCREEIISTMDALYAKVNHLSEENDKLRKENEKLKEIAATFAEGEELERRFDAEFAKQERDS